MATMVYSLKDFEGISWENKITLDDTTIELINTITNQVSSPDYVKTPSFTNNEKPYRKRKKNIPDLKPEDWESIRNFKKTEIIKKEGIDKEIDNIRLLVNKLTEKTYNIIIEKICTTLDELNDNENYDELSIDKIGYAIFNMATANKFNSNIYAKLCYTLKNKYDFMVPIIENNILEFMKLFDKMEFVNPSEDYDKFCDMNLENDKRRSMSLFLTSLEKHKVVTHDFVFDNILNIHKRIMDNKSNECMKVENDELTENLLVLLTNVDSPTKSDKWNCIYNNMIDIKSNKYPGITTKCKFKHMDILDYIKKNNM